MLHQRKSSFCFHCGGNQIFRQNYFHKRSQIVDMVFLSAKQTLKTISNYEIQFLRTGLALSNKLKEVIKILMIE